MNAPALPVDRQTFIGGSDAAVILGVSPWKTPLQLYEEKVNGRAPETEAKLKLFARGHRWEPIALEMLVDALSADDEAPVLTERNKRYIDAEHPFLACEIDAELLIGNELVNVELKTVHPFKAHEWGEEGSEEVPVHYAAQAMHGLAITGRRLCIVGALFGADNLVPFKVVRDDETIKAMREKSVAFWNNHVLARVPPEPSNMADIMRLFAKVNGKPVEASEPVLHALRRLQAIRGSMNAMEGEKEEIEFEIADYVRRQWGVPDPDTATQQIDDAVLTVGGKPVATWKKQSRSSLNTKALQAALPDIYKQYQRETWFRTIRFSKS